MRGKIIKGIAGFYEVQSGDSVYTCKARGIFRKDGRKPLVGDYVLFSEAETEESEANIEELLPRKNELIRPAAANVDLTVVVLAVRKPDPQLFLVDRYLVALEERGVPAVLVFNKEDLDKNGKLAELRRIYEDAGYTVIGVSAKDGTGLDRLKELIRGKTAVLAGPSGVGKSSITNRLFENAGMETGDISRRIARGKQTTRHTELFSDPDGTCVMDTPGFTSVFVDEDAETDLAYCFPEMRALIGTCRYTGCRHLSEPGCGVKAAVADGRIHASRYESYQKLMDEQNEKEKRKYT